MSRQCRGYANSLPIVAPFISGLSTTSSILGATTIVTIFGENFRNFSTVYFGTTLINNVTYFSSGQLSFYVPAIATVGTYPIQVFNDTLASNIVYFTIDNSVGFWNQDPATGAITNNNATGGININGQLTVSGNETVNGTLTVSGQIYNTATQPAPTNSSTIIPTTAWVQSAILTALTPVITTYTSQNLNIPVLPNKRTCSISMIARGGTAGSILTNDGGTWRFGGAGGAGSGVIISNITIPINTAYFILQILEQVFHYLGLMEVLYKQFLHVLMVQMELMVELQLHLQEVLALLVLLIFQLVFLVLFLQILMVLTEQMDLILQTHHHFQ